MVTQSKQSLMEQSRKRRTDSGLVRVEVQIKPGDKGKLSDFVNDQLGGIYNPRSTRDPDGLATNECDFCGYHNETLGDVFGCPNCNGEGLEE